MTAVQVIRGDVLIQGNLRVTGEPQALSRSQLTQEDGARYKIPLTHWRVWDALATNLPGTSANDDLGLIGGTFGTASPSIQTSDMKALGAVTRYARATFNLPTEYVAGQTVIIRASAGMLTTVADTSATLDFVVYRSDDDTSIGSDLCSTSATTINSLTFADVDFTITSATLAPGDTLDIRMAVAVNDGATATAVIACIGGIEVLLDVKG